MFKLLIGTKPTNQAPNRALYKDGYKIATFDYLMDYKDYERSLLRLVGEEEYVEVECPYTHVLQFPEELEGETVSEQERLEERLKEIKAEQKAVEKAEKDRKAAEEAAAKAAAKAAENDNK